MAQFLNYILNDDALVIVTNEGLKPLIKGNPYYAQVVDFLKKHLYDKALEMMDLASRIAFHSKGQFHLQDGQIFYKGTLMPKGLSERIVQFADLGIPFKALINFWDNLMQNPSVDSRNDLFAFLMHNHIPLTEDGCFIGYKRVGEDFLDLYTRTIDNSVGKCPKMPRELVDPNRKNTCSRGLHVAAWKYAKDQYMNGNLIAVKVNPKDVVAVPEDYNGEKMRVCLYEVMEKVDGPRKTAIYPEYKVGAVVAVLPNMDDCQNYFVGMVLEVILKDGETPSYRIRKANSEEIVTFPQHHVMFLDSETCKDNEEEEEEDGQFCPDCGEESDNCTCSEEDCDDNYDDEDDD